MTAIRQLIPKNLLALASGAALVPAFAPFDIWILAVLSPAVLIGLWREAPPGAAFRYGYLYGLGLFGAGTGWLHISINLFGGVNLAGAIVLTCLFVLFIALFPACAGWLCARLYRKDLPDFSLLLLFPAIWTLLEWIRSWFLTGFPWLTLGYSQTNTVLGGLAPLTGVLGTSFALMLTAGALCRWVSRTKTINRLIAPAAVLLVWGAGAWSGAHDWTRARDESLSVVLVQGSIAQELKWTPQMLRPTMDKYMELTRPHLGADLILWPEAAIPAFYDQIEPYMRELMALAGANGSWLLAGLPYRDPDAGAYLNSIVLLDHQPSFYFKRHLVPFGEYLPFNSLLRGIVDYFGIPMSDFSSGVDVPPLLQTDRFGIGVSICYEDTFGNEVIEALPDAAILVNVSNDAWFGDSLAPHQHLQMARMRAIETGRYLLRATNTGITAIIDEKGGIVDSAPQFTSMTLTGTARLFDGMTPYAYTGNYLIVVLILLLIAPAILTAINRRSG